MCNNSSVSCDSVCDDTQLDNCSCAGCSELNVQTFGNIRTSWTAFEFTKISEDVTKRFSSLLRIPGWIVIKSLQYMYKQGKWVLKILFMNPARTDMG
jgi:hypothetical protein